MLLYCFIRMSGASKRLAESLRVTLRRLVIVEAELANSGKVVSALRLTPIEWRELQRTYCTGDLLMPCCKGAAIPKISANGYQFFAHAGGACSFSEEGEWHQAAKILVRCALEEIGCVASIEEPGEGEAGGWRADVFAERGDTKLAVEIQRSYQSLQDYRDRQERYLEAGQNVLWLLRADRYSTLLRSMGKERLRTEFGGKFPPAGHFHPCLPEIPVACLQLEPAPQITGAGFLSATLPSLLGAALTRRFLWVDGQWRIVAPD